MLARRPLPPEYKAWNAKWGAPFGYSSRWRNQAARIGRIAADPRLFGPFSIQPNNDTRRFEYPWAYLATPLAPGMRVVEIGGSLSGFQFVLSKEGLTVVNVDPGEAATGVGWPCTPEAMARLNRAFGTDVELRNTTLDRAEIADGSVDRVFSISTIEHIPPSEIPGLARDIRRILKPGGYAVLTLDLFLDVAPFTEREKNVFGTNIDVKHLVDDLGLEMVVGEPAQLCGFPEFEPTRILGMLATLVYGRKYPTCVQLLVLRAPE